MNWHRELLKRALDHTDDIGEALLAAEIAIAEQPLPESYFAFDIYNRRAQGILNRALKAAKDLSASTKRALERAIKITDPRESAVALIEFLETYRVELARILSSTQMAALLEGAREVASHIPPVPPSGFAFPIPPALGPEGATALLDRLKKLQGLAREQAIYELPPDQQRYVRGAIDVEPSRPIVPPVPGADDPGREQFPIIEEAARLLSERNVMSRAAYDNLDAAARQKAFTVAGIESTETLTEIRDMLAESAATGVDYEAFREKALARVGAEEFLSEGHMENIFRTNIQTAFSDGQMAVLNHPFIKSGFPYSSIEPILDNRTRHEHAEMKNLGIDGTNVYRTNDPVFQIFRPPWSWNCVPGDSLVLTRTRGRVRIENITKADEVLTHLGRFRRVLGTHRTEGVTKLVAIELESGAFARATGEHRFFTQRGWIEAACLNIDDEVYQITDAAAPYLVMLKVDDRFEPKGIANRGISMSIGTTGISLYFHAYSDGREIKIQPEWKGLLIKNELDATHPKFGGKCLFVTTHTNNSIHMKAWVAPSRFPPSGDHLCANFGTARSAMDSVRRTHLFRSLWVEPVVHGIGVATRTKDDAFGLKKPLESPESDSGDSRNVGDASLLIDIIADSAIGTSRPFGQTCLGVLEIGERAFWLFSHDYNCNMVGRKIKSIRNVPWDGPVYNLSVEEDESYVCDDLATHNCRCSWIPKTVRQAAEEGLDEAKRWLDSGVEPRPAAFVQMPPFRPPPGFVRQSIPMSVQLSMQSLEKWGANLGMEENNVIRTISPQPVIHPPKPGVIMDNPTTSVRIRIPRKWQ